GMALSSALCGLTSAPVPSNPYPLPVRVTFLAGAFFVLLLTGSAFAQRAGFWGLSMGIWLWWSIISLLLAWGLPGVSVIFLCPTIRARLLLAVVGFSPLYRAPYSREIATLVALFATSSLWL